MAQVSRRMGVSSNTLYRWRQEYGVLKIDQAWWLREMESENTR